MAAAVGLVTTLVLQPIQVAAYNDLDFQCSWENPSGYLYVNYKWGSINTAGGWANDFRLGTTAWSDAGSKLRMGYSASAVSEVSTYYAVESRPGYANIWCNWWNNKMADFDLFGNTYVHSDSGTSTYRRATAAHELGHGAGLSHSAYSSAVMYKYVNYGIYTPATDDVEGLNAMYPW